MQIFPKGPDYPYAQRWWARFAAAVLTIPFIPVAYGFGWAVDYLLDEDPVEGGLFVTALFLGVLFASWVVQWRRPFTQ